MRNRLKRFMPRTQADDFIKNQAEQRFAFTVPVSLEELREKYPEGIIVGFIIRDPSVEWGLMVVADDGS